MMKNLIISNYVKLFELLSLESKVELLSMLTESLKNGIVANRKDKGTIARELFGAWSDIDDDITELIYSSRTTSNQEINLD